MKNCVDHYISVYKELMKQVEDYESQEQLDLYGLGKLSLLKKSKSKCLIKLRSLEYFYKHTDLDHLKLPCQHFLMNCQVSYLYTYVTCNGRVFPYPLESGNGKNGHIIHSICYTKLQCYVFVSTQLTLTSYERYAKSM